MALQTSLTYTLCVCVCVCVCACVCVCVCVCACVCVCVCVCVCFTSGKHSYRRLQDLGTTHLSLKLCISGKRKLVRHGVHMYLSVVCCWLVGVCRLGHTGINMYLFVFLVCIKKCTCIQNGSMYVYLCVCVYVY